MGRPLHIGMLCDRSLSGYETALPVFWRRAALKAQKGILMPFIKA